MKFMLCMIFGARTNLFYEKLWSRSDKTNERLKRTKKDFFCIKEILLFLFVQGEILSVFTNTTFGCPPFFVLLFLVLHCAENDDSLWCYISEWREKRASLFFFFPLFFFFFSVFSSFEDPKFSHLKSTLPWLLFLSLLCLFSLSRSCLSFFFSSFVAV